MLILREFTVSLKTLFSLAKTYISKWFEVTIARRIKAELIVAKAKKEKSKSSTIALNKKAKHDYFIEDRYEAGLTLEGWEVKSIRAGHVQINESYILLQNGEAFLFGANITALPTASTHIKPDPTRNRKCLLHRTELNRLIGAVERKGFTLIPTALYWKHGLVKLEIGVAQGKKAHDKRATEKEKDWKREKQRLLKIR